MSGAQGLARPPLLSWLLNYSEVPGDWHLHQAVPHQQFWTGKEGHTRSSGPDTLSSQEVPEGGPHSRQAGQTWGLLMPDQDSLPPGSPYHHWRRGQFPSHPLLLEQVSFSEIGGSEIRPINSVSHTSFLYLSFPKCINHVTWLSPRSALNFSEKKDHLDFCFQTLPPCTPSAS